MDDAVAVIDVGKTHAKLSLWSREGTLLQRTERVNAPTRPGQLDVDGIGVWLKQELANLARRARIIGIVPVAHGAAAVLLDGERALAALDYETPIPPEVEAAYEAERDPFAVTLSPRLAGGLNLGAQLFWLERLDPEVWPHGGRALLWPQYWAFVLCGQTASEVTSLGCHSDLWRPLEGRLSDLALRRGWAERLGPLRRAGDVLGAVLPALARQTGLPADCQVYCGLHDSNAALHAARANAELTGPFAVVSTGTWFIALNSGGRGPAAYDPRQDMLAGVDVDGRATPTARFMGGRDYETWMGEAIGAAGQLELAAEARTLSEWTAAPPELRATRAALELAERTARALTLIAAEGPILIEGRFADDPVFGAALAASHPGRPVYRSDIADGVSLGALRLAVPELKLAGRLRRVAAP